MSVNVPGVATMGGKLELHDEPLVVGFLRGLDEGQDIAITGLGYVRDGQTGSHPTTTVAQVPLTLERTPTKVGSPRSVARSARCTPRLDRHLPTESPCGGGGLPPHFWAFAHCVQECPSTFATDWHEVAVGVKFLSPISSIASNVSTLEEGNPLLHKANGGARGIRTLDPSYPGYRISRSPERGAGQGTPGHLVFRTASVGAPRGMQGNPRWDSVGPRDRLCAARPKR
jgi:hypothetical protein